MLFSDRMDAGTQLAGHLAGRAGPDAVILGLPRGGVEVALPVALSLRLPLDVVVVRKLGVPSQPELAMGAVGEEGARVLNRQVVDAAGVSSGDIAAVEERERAEVRRRAATFRGSRPAVPLLGRHVVIVDDGIATGSTARAACEVARARGAARVTLAVPVAPQGWEARMGDVADELVALETPHPFHAIGQFYGDFAQTSDERVLECLAAAPR